MPIDNKANIKKENGKEIFNNKKDADNDNKINNKVNIKKEIANRDIDELKKQLNEERNKNKILEEENKVFKNK